MTSRRSLRSLLRALAFLGLVLCLVAQPVLGAMGELHELKHAARQVDHHADHGSLADELAATNESDDDGAAALHAVQHLMHCCGSSAAVTPTALAVLPRMHPDMPLARARLQPILIGRLGGVFRPPITA